MKFALFALLAGVQAGSIICRNDLPCSSNYFKKKCCSDFQCNAYCNTTRCRTNTCGKTLCAKQAHQFVTTQIRTQSKNAFGQIVAVGPVAQQCKFSTSGPAWKPREEEEFVAELNFDQEFDNIFRASQEEETEMTDCRQYCSGFMGQHTIQCQKCMSREEDVEEETEMTKAMKVNCPSACKKKCGGTTGKYEKCYKRCVTACGKTEEEEEETEMILTNQYCKKRCNGLRVPCYPQCVMSRREEEAEEETEMTDCRQYCSGFMGQHTIQCQKCMSREEEEEDLDQLLEEFTI